MFTQIQHIKLTVIGFALFLIFLISSASGQQTIQLDQMQKKVTDRFQLKEIKKMFATSADIDSQNKTYVVLYWGQLDGVVGYNLYRRKKQEQSMPTSPVNGKKPIAFVKTCAEFKAIIPEGSKEWKMLERAFSSMSIQEKTKTKSSTQNKGSSNQIQSIQPAVKTALDFGAIKQDISQLRLSLCFMIDRGLTTDEQEIFNNLALVNLKFKQASGLAYIDDQVVANEHYVYELRAVQTDSKEIVLAQNVNVWAGHYTLPAPPTAFTLTAGDGKVLARWDRNSAAYDYELQRSIDPIEQPFRTIHEEPIYYDIYTDLKGDSIMPAPGFVDFQRWSADGLPISHKVNNVDINGPKNYIKYQYRVGSRDILGRRDKWSSIKMAMPTDQTPPMAARDLVVSPSTAVPSKGLVLIWGKVTRDINGHQELDSQHTYKIYRAAANDDLDKTDPTTGLIPPSTFLVSSIIVDPTDKDSLTITWTDNASVIFPTHGEKDFYYRVTCTDAHNNTSAPSAAISGRTPDITPPGKTHVIRAEPDSDKITIIWKPNEELDLAGYQIYRGICDYGKMYNPDAEKKGCGFVLIGEILVEQAKKRLEQTGDIFYTDSTVSKESPICYAYWVRAFDMARNVYLGTYECPASRDEYVCQRVYERIPPPAPIISGMKAKNNSVVIDWISSPVQDLRAFHVYRAKSETDTQLIFAGCVLSNGASWTGKWTGTDAVCEDIPAEPNPASVKGSFTDKGLIPNQVYWYRVSALDWLGNESMSADITKIPAMSTFTYSKDLPAAPVVLPPSSTTAPDCGLIVRWTPSFDSNKVKGFLIFRSVSQAGTFRQVSSVVKTDAFTDKSAIKSMDYWYKVQAIDKQDKLSKPSVAVHYKY